MNLDQARFFMVEQQIRPWDVLDPKVLELFNTQQRHEFVKPEQQSLAYSDIELPIGEGQHMLAPKIEARMLQALDIDPQDTVLEIGTGSGFMTALLASLAQSVKTIDMFESLQAEAKNRLTQFNNIRYEIGDASQDWPDNQIYDVIVLTGSVGEISEQYKQKLALGGRLFAITGQAPAMQAKLITRISDQEWLQEALFETQTTALINGEAKPAFSL